MSLQVFLQAQLLGAHEFLAQPVSLGAADPSASFLGRCIWLNLYCEVLPRALLSELRLSRMLLGSASSDQFLLVLAEEDIPRANELLAAANQSLDDLSGNTLRLTWAITENLGAWPVARKRLDEGLDAHVATSLASRPDPAPLFAVADSTNTGDFDAYFAELAAAVTNAKAVSWSPENPATVRFGEGQYQWPLVEQASDETDSIVLARRIAQNDDGQPLAIPELAQRAAGAPRWGILIGDVDHFDAQLKLQASVEEHIHLSVLFKEFFAGELSVLCTLPEFWRKVTLLYRGGNGFVVAGSWDALVSLARELQRLFTRFAEENLQSAATPDGKTISMALAIAGDNSPIPSVYRQAASGLKEAKTAAPGTFHLFGRTLEWKRLADAEELKTSLVRLVDRHGYSPDYIHDLAAVYRESSTASRAATRRKAPRIDKPWRTYMRLSSVIPQVRGKDVNNLRNAVIASLIGKRTAALKLRPSGRVGLEWARLATGTEVSTNG